MRTGEIVTELFTKMGISQADYARRRGISRSAVQSFLSHGNADTDNLLRYLGDIGYDLVVVPKAASIACEHYVVTDSNTPIDDRTAAGLRVNMHGDSDELIG